MRNEELHDLYFRLIKSRGKRWAGHVALWGRRAAWVEESEGKRPLEQNRRRWKRMDLEEIGWESADCFRLAPDRDLSGSCDSVNEPSRSI